jgi:ATP-dependent exoDNAse (exonuclease V) alpha subunit
LWDEAERAEKRSNSRVAREYEMALPHELTQAQRLELVRGFAAGIADRHGVAVDFAIHAPHREGDLGNQHAHLLATTRVIESGGLGEKAAIEWSDANRRKAGLEPARKEIEAIRELGLPFRVDHRSLEV